MILNMIPSIYFFYRGCTKGDVHIWNLDQHHPSEKEKQKKPDSESVMVLTDKQFESEDKNRSCEAAKSTSDGDKSNTVEPVLVTLKKHEKPSVTIHGHNGIMICVEYSHSGTLIASGCADGVVNIWSSKVCLSTFSPCSVCNIMIE